ncbi:MAG: sigma-54 dependent transcriptional regulator [Syntrophobacteraceae bacterium]|jgi:two-component system response regulator HydG
MNQAEPGKKLLVIDDEPSTLKMLRLLLGAYGYFVLTAGTGEEGLEIFRNERPALVITDIRMPGMDGIEVLTRLREISPEVEMIVITGHGDMELAVRSLRNSASDFINKPIRRDALEIALQRAEEKIELKRKIRDHAKELESRVEQATAALSHQVSRLEVLVKIGKQAGEIPAYGKMAEFLREKIQSSTGLGCPRIMVLNTIRDGLHGDHSNSRQAKGSAMAAEMIKGLRGSLRLVTLQELEKMQLPLVEAEGRQSIAMLPIDTEEGDPVGAALVVASGEREDGDLEFAGLLLSLVAGALRRAVVQEEEISSLRQIVEKEKFGNMIGRHEKMRRVFNLISNVAASDASVLILGESGTGKELAARRIHELSSRSSGPFIVLDCAAYPQTLLEAEMFGHEKGAFTGAVHSRKGLFELAQGGTLFLDEVGDIPLPSQVKLLRALQFKEFHRLGSETVTKVDVRVLSATARHLREEIERGTFREDLYYRLHVIPIVMPPLRERLTDLPLLVSHFLERLSGGAPKKVIRPDAMQVLFNHNWPGNIRELENAIEHAFILAGTGDIKAADLPAYLHGYQKLSHPASEGLDQVERSHVMKVLQECRGNKIMAARRLRISRSTLYRKLEQFDIK